jgi:acyl carrier protein phosphodiesterase
LNYLAHFCLSGQDEEIIVGNFIGDSLKGISVDSFPKKIQIGIHLHRHIDNFTDHHTEFIAAKKIFSSQFDKFSGALTDIFFDHFLAVHFNIFYAEDLQTFANNCYQTIKNHYEILPQRAKDFFYYMKKNNILFNYIHTSTIEKVLIGMSHRIKHQINLAEALPTLLLHYQEIEHHFLSFYPSLQITCKDFLTNKK